MHRTSKPSAAMSTFRPHPRMRQPRDARCDEHNDAAAYEPQISATLDSALSCGRTYVHAHGQFEAIERSLRCCSRSMRCLVRRLSQGGHWFEILAERVGFEPTSRLRSLRFSRPVQSTALPPLRSNLFSGLCSFYQAADTDPVPGVATGKTCPNRRVGCQRRSRSGGWRGRRWVRQPSGSTCLPGRSPRLRHLSARPLHRRDPPGVRAPRARGTREATSRT
jgi:hypothetical protein